MSFQAHREGDLRACGATTVVTEQTSVRINGKLWAVVGSKSSHGGGALINTTGTSIRINGIDVIVQGPDKTTEDCVSPFHEQPTENQTASGAVSVKCY